MDNVLEWNSDMVCKWLEETCKFNDQTIGSFKKYSIIGEDLSMLSDKRLKEMGLDLRGRISFDVQFKKLIEFNNNNNNNNNSDNNDDNKNIHNNININLENKLATNNLNKNIINNNLFISSTNKPEIIKLNEKEIEKLNPDKNTTVPYTVYVKKAPYIEMKGYEFVEIIGQGSYGTVSKYKTLSNPSEFIAVKSIKIGLLREDKIAEEINNLYSINHPNIIKIIGYNRDKENYHIITKFYKNNSIRKMIDSSKSRMNEKKVVEISKKILGAIEYLHKLKPIIIHRDIKGDNILLDENNEPILADFGVSYRAEDEKSNFRTQCGTPFWMAPEIQTNNQSQFSRKCDIWSFGCFILEMLVGGDPWLGKFKPNSSPPIPNNISRECQEFLKLCFYINPNYRPSCTKLFDDCWLNQVKIASHTQITSNILLEEFKKDGVSFIVDGSKYYKLDFDFDINDYEIASKNDFSYLNVPQQADSKYKKKVEYYYKQFCKCRFRIRVGPYTVVLNENEYIDFYKYKNFVIEKSLVLATEADNNGQIRLNTVRICLKTIILKYVYTNLIYDTSRFLEL